MPFNLSEYLCNLGFDDRLDDIESSPEYGQLEFVEETLDMADAIQLGSSVLEPELNQGEAPTIFENESNDQDQGPCDPVSSQDVKLNVRRFILAKRSGARPPTADLTANHASGDHLIVNQNRLIANQPIQLTGPKSKKTPSSCRIEENVTRRAKNVHTTDHNVFPPRLPAVANSGPYSLNNVMDDMLNRSRVLTNGGGFISPLYNEYQNENDNHVNNHNNGNHSQSEAGVYEFPVYFYSSQQNSPMIEKYDYSSNNYFWPQ